MVFLFCYNSFMKKSFGDLGAIRRAHSKERIVFLAGTFDLFHVGHLAYLRKAKKLGDILVVGVNSDVRTRRVKGSARPVIAQDHRAEIIARINEVDYSFVMPEKYVKNLRPTFQVIQQLQPDLFVVADDGWSEANTFYKQHRTRLILLPRIAITSTSRIIEQIRTGIAK